MNITTIGIDLAKSIFQLHGANSCGKKTFSKRVSREKFTEIVQQLPASLIGMEACGSAHYWARRFTQMGHRVQLMSPQYVKPYVKTNKNDRNDAEAICEAVTRPTMRFVAIKTVEQQDIQLLHKVRTKIIKEKVALGNQIRGLLMEYGVAIPQGDCSLKKALADLSSIKNSDLTENSIFIFNELYTEFLNLELRMEQYTKKLLLISKQNESCKRLMSIPGIGEITSTALISSIGNFSNFKNGRNLSAWLGLVPRQNSSGQKTRLLGISKRGDKYLRSLLIHGARAVVNQVKDKVDKTSLWIKGLLEKNGFNKTVVALANKNARIAWSVITKDTNYNAEHAHG
ncbi:IS110 family transposase [Legionella cincinnatiensis]|uniref:Transposase n=1 Tax=Legionella cincinnatiensis TaxID=28085 RepID=A0A378IJX6_9GAMM|nr:IS110 family transposase [Legionella cincinnatiensis]KTC78735.1 transposase [Legionella cincinnatiensis]STX35323.1 transposase [Legionella cincinnatiensis]